MVLWPARPRDFDSAICPAGVGLGARRAVTGCVDIAEQRKAKKEAARNDPGAESGAVTSTIALFALMLSSAGSLSGGSSGWF